MPIEPDEVAERIVIEIEPSELPSGLPIEDGNIFDMFRVDWEYGEP